mgnify:CR=1 FL=1
MRASLFSGRTNAGRIGRSDVERLMRRRKIVAWVVTLIVVCAVTSFSSGNRTGGYGVGSVPSAVRSATTPLSSYENGLVDTPDPIDSSDRVVTGNVTGGKHFRGALPYRPPTSIDAPLGSTSLDPFLRRTAPAPVADDATGVSGSFYSPTGTVTTPGAGTAYTGQTPPSRYTSGSDLGLRPGDTTSAEIPVGDLVTGWPASTQGGAVAAREDYQQQMRQLQETLAQVKAELVQLERSIAAGAEAAEPGTRTVPPDSPALPDSVMQAAQPVSPADASRRRELLQETARLLSATTGLLEGSAAQSAAALGQADAGAASDTDADAQPRLRLYEAQEQEPASSGAPLSIDALVAPRTRQTAKELPAVQRINEAARAFDTTGAVLNRPQAAVPVPAASPGVELPSGYRVLGQGGDSALAPIKAATTTTPPPASPPDHDSSSSKMFERHLQSGRQLMQQGQFQRAADAFALASAYRPNDARAHLGKGHALLAAGRYLDSALFIARAVELDLPAVLQRTDLIQIVGGPDPFIRHFNELDRLIGADGGPQLQFLMAYIYYQMDRPAEAKAAIDAAQKQMPTSTPVHLLRSAICQ